MPTLQKLKKPQKPQKPSKKQLIQFGWFNLGGASFFIIGYAIFALLYGLLGVHWLPAKIIGDTVGWSTNFAIQYFIAFKEESRAQSKKSVTTKFTIFSLLNLAIDYGIVASLNSVGVSPFIGLFVASGFFTIWKWLWYKHWIFKKSAILDEKHDK
jgi:putative flippase GtrA